VTKERLSQLDGSKAAGVNVAPRESSRLNDCQLVSTGSRVQRLWLFSNDSDTWSLLTARTASRPSSGRALRQHCRPVGVGWRTRTVMRGEGATAGSGELVCRQTFPEVSANRCPDSKEGTT
jgi:hypothetical protein